LELRSLMGIGHRALQVKENNTGFSSSAVVDKKVPPCLRRSGYAQAGLKLCEAPRPSRYDGTRTPGASRKGNFIFIVPLDPARAGLVGHLPANIPARPLWKSIFSHLPFMEPHGQSPWYLHVLRRNPPKHTLLRTRLRRVILFAFIHGHRPWSSA
jgi:hypothetical protein